MVEKSSLSHNLDSVTDNVRYDQNAKNILANKSILAWILKYTTSEFRDYNIPAIIDCIDEPQISEVSIYPGETNVIRTERIEGLPTEDTVQNEGSVRYDIRFSAYTKDDEHIKLIINVDAQKSFYPGYDLVTRVIYYCTRMISSQMDVEFKSDDYDNIKKVYSIFICLESNAASQNSITSYEIAPHNLYGNLPDKHRYDLMRAVVVCLGNGQIGNGTMDDGSSLLSLLNVTFDGTLSADAKENILEEQYSIPKSKKMKEELTTMCNLSYAIEEKGIEKGRAEGIEKGRAEGVEMGRAEGVEMMSKLMYLLNAEGRIDDISKASVDKDYRDKLLKEFNLI